MLWAIEKEQIFLLLKKETTYIEQKLGKKRESRIQKGWHGSSRDTSTSSITSAGGLGEPEQNVDVVGDEHATEYSYQNQDVVGDEHATEYSNQNQSVLESVVTNIFNLCMLRENESILEQTVAKTPPKKVDFGLEHLGGVAAHDTKLPSTTNTGTFIKCGDKITQNEGIQTFKVVYCNVNGLAKKSITYTESMLYEENIDIFAICEHKKRRKQDLPQFHNYVRWASCRENGGGSAIWIKRNIFHRVTTIPMAAIKKEWEEDQVWVAIETGTQKIALGTLYIRPEGPTKEELSEKMQAINLRTLELQELGFSVILMGDFNAKFKTDTNGIVRDDEAGRCLLDMVILTELEILNFNSITQGKNTWVPQGKREKQTTSTLDYIIHDTNIEIKSCKIDEGRDLYIDSDHVPIIWEFSDKIHTTTEHQPDEPTYWNEFTDVDWNAYNSLVEYNLFMEEYNADQHDFTPTYEQIHKAIYHAGEEIIGKKVKKEHKIKREPFHITIVRRKLAKARRSLTKQMKKPEKYKDCKKIDRYRAQVWALRQNVRELEREEETRKTYKFMDSIKRERDKNMKKLFTYMNKNKKPVAEVFGLKDENGSWITSEADIKLQLKKQWDKIYYSGYWQPQPPECKYTDLKISEDDKNNLEENIKVYEVDKAIEQLRTATSVGTTDIPPELIKNLDCRGRRAIWKWATKIWNDSDPPPLNDVLRTTFLHKKGATDTLDNYRTLTIGCNICKLYNRILTNRIQEATENSDILGEIQNGFRPGRRASDNLLVLETIV